VAITVVAPGVRFSAFAIFFTPDLAFAMVSSAEHHFLSTRDEQLSLFLLLPFCFPILFHRLACITASNVGNYENPNIYVINAEGF
jgi:hypothetical protein